MLLEFNINNSKNDLYSLYDGYVRGNMFESLYKPYKNYKVYNIGPTNKNEEDRFELMMLEFALNDLNLHLIIYPDDIEIQNKYQYYLKMYKVKKDEYDKKKTKCDSTDKNTFMTFTALPWEVDHV